MGLEFSFDEFWSQPTLEFKQSVVEFARESLTHDVVALDRDLEFSRDAWNRCAEFGLLGLCLPSDLGGRGGGIARAVVAMEGLGYACRDNGLTFGINAQTWTTQMSIFEFGTRDQRRRYLPDLCSGKIIAAQAITEPDSGSDAYSLKTLAREVDGGYVLSGEKIMVTLGPEADVILVLATVDASLGQWGVTAFLVDRDTPGLLVEPAREKMGLRTIPLGHVTLNDCFVPEGGLLGQKGGGAALSSASLEWERGCMLASQIGILERQLEQSVAESRTRKQFGKAIGSFQTIGNRVAEMKIRLEASRMAVYRTAWLKGQGKSAVLEAAIAKFQLGEALLQSGIDTVRIHGGRGYLTENEVERDLRDAMGTVLYGGTSDIQRVVIARLLGLPA